MSFKKDSDQKTTEAQKDEKAGKLSFGDKVQIGVAIVIVLSVVGLIFYNLPAVQNIGLVWSLPGTNSGSFVQTQQCINGEVIFEYVENCLEKDRVYVFQQASTGVVAFIDTTWTFILFHPGKHPVNIIIGCEERHHQLLDIYGTRLDDARNAVVHPAEGEFIARVRTKEAGENSWVYLEYYYSMSQASRAICGSVPQIRD